MWWYFGDFFSSGGWVNYATEDSLGSSIMAGGSGVSTTFSFGEVLVFNLLETNFSA